MRSFTYRRLHFAPQGTSTARERINSLPTQRVRCHDRRRPLLQRALMNCQMTTGSRDERCCKIPRWLQNGSEFYTKHLARRPAKPRLSANRAVRNEPILQHENRVPSPPADQCLVWYIHPTPLSCCPFSIAQLILWERSLTAIYCICHRNNFEAERNRRPRRLPQMVMCAKPVPFQALATYDDVSRDPFGNTRTYENAPSVTEP